MITTRIDYGVASMLIIPSFLSIKKNIYGSKLQIIKKGNIEIDGNDPTGATAHSPYTVLIRE